MKNYTQILASLLSVLALAACGGVSKNNFGYSGDQMRSTGPGCTASTVTKPLRIFVMVDNSGSTADTDPNQKYRVATLQKFLQTYGGNTNLSYAFGYFDDAAHVYNTSTAHFAETASAFAFGQSTPIANALNLYHSSIPPSGSTAYGAAMTAIQSAVTQNEQAGYTQDYAVVFMSDGQPTDLSGNVGAQITGLVSRLQNATQANGKSHVTVSTVYFGDASDAVSIQNLQAMAAAGNGQFVDTNHPPPQGVALDTLIAVPGC